MKRLVLPVLAALTTLAASSALADEAAKRGCTETTAIVANAVALRTGGADRAEALAELRAGDMDAKYADAVQPLLDWVYTLPQDQLTDEAATAYKDACLAQLG